MGYWTGIIGAWIFSDGLYSINLYWRAASYRKEEVQSWRKDHWIRCVRMALGMALVGLGWLIERG